MKNKYLFLASALIVTTTAFAHGDLQKLTKQEVTDIQKTLVAGKYLTEADFKYGVVNLKTEDAYDVYQEDQLKIRIQEENATYNNSTNTLKDIETPKNFWQKILDFLKNFL